MFLDKVKTNTLKTLAVFSLCSLMVCTQVACSTSWIKTIETIEPVAIAAVQSIIDIIALLGGKTVNPADVATVTSISNQINTDLNTALVLVEAYNSSNATTTIQKVNAALSAAESNLNQILTALHVTDAATIAKITALVNLVQAQITAWENLIPVLQGNAKAHLSLVTIPLNKKQFRDSFNKVMHSPSGNPVVDAAAAQVKSI